jgi:phage gp29-like protein
MAKDKVKNQDLMVEVATVERDFIAPPYGGIMYPSDDTLISRGGGKGLKIYDDLERDGHTYAVLQKRKMAIIAREYVVEAASEKPLDVQAAELVRTQLANANFDLVCLNLMDAILKGYAVGEVMWKLTPDGIVLDEVRPKDQRRFVFDTQSQVRLLTMENIIEGIPVPDRKFLVHRFGAKYGNPYGLGLGHKLFWPVYFKRQGITFWLTFADKFGSPTAIGEYPANASQEERNKLLRALYAISREAGITIPNGMAIKFLEAARSGSIDTYEKLCRYMDEQISECVLGETLTTNIGSTGSRAASETHNEVRKELSKADADLLSETLNKSLLPWIVELNLPGATPPKVWRVFKEAEDLDKRATRDQIIFGMGYRPTPEYIRQTYGEGWVPTVLNSGITVDTGASPEFSEAATLPPDAADRCADHAGKEAPGFMDSLVAPIQRLITEAGSLEDIRDGLLELYPEMNGEGLSKLVSQAMGSAQLAGMYEVQNGQ